MAPDWAKAAEHMKGIVQFGAVNCDDEKELAGQYGVQGFPTIKVFPAGKKTSSMAQPYEGARSAAAFSKAAVDLVPNFVKRLKKTEDAKRWFSTSKPKAVLVTNKDTTPLLYKALASEFKKVMDFAEIRHSEKELVALYGEGDKFPIVKVYTEAHGDEEVPQGYVFEGKIDKAVLGKWLASFVSGSSASADENDQATEKPQKSRVTEKKDTPPPKPKELESDFRIVSTLEELRKAGENAQYKSKVLAVFLVPDSEAVRDEVKSFSVKYRNDHLAFVSAPLDSDVARIWNVDGRAAAPKLDRTEPRMVLVKPKRHRVAYVIDIQAAADVSDRDDDNAADELLDAVAVCRALDRAIGGDLTYLNVRLEDDDNDWVDGLLRAGGAQDSHEQELHRHKTTHVEDVDEEPVPEISLSDDENEDQGEEDAPREEL